MDFEYSDSDYMQKLYEEFRKHVYDNDLTTVSYTTDELLDIYDYAIDSNDALVQMYVFEVAAAQYPGNDFLDERKAFFLAQIDEKASRGMLNRKGRAESALWKVLELSDPAISPEEWEQKLTELLSSDMVFSSETIIRLVEIARDTDHLDWLIEQIDLLKSKAEHPEVVLNEIGHAVYEDGANPNIGIELAEELTANNPFNPDFWVLLASLQRSANLFSESLISCDYALAIDPEHANALAAKGFALTQGANHENRLQAVELMERARKQIPNDSYLLERLAQTYLALNKKNVAGDIYLDLMMRHHSLATYALTKIADISPGMFGKALQSFTIAVGEDENSWIEAARILITSDNHDQALAMMEYCQSHFAMQNTFPIYLELLYKVGKYQEYINVCEHYLIKTSPENFSSFALLMLASAYLQTGDKESARAMCLLLQSYPPSENLPSDFIFQRGISTSLMILEKLLESDNVAPLSDGFDPLTSQILPHE